MRRRARKLVAPAAGGSFAPRRSSATNAADRLAAECPRQTRCPAPPSDLTEKILASRESLEGERKQVTVLFADVKGSMDLQADLDPEEWAKIMGRFVDILADGVHRFEGTVDKFTGDGIMALFGAPIAFEDHARRACHAALHLTEAHRGLCRGAPEDARAELPRPPGTQLRRGRRRPDRRRRAHGVHGHRPDGRARAADGDARQAGQRLPHGGHGALGDRVLPHEGPRRPVRSRASPSPVHVFDLEGVGPLRSGLDVARQRGLSRFVGRDTEMAILEAAFEQAMSGNAQVVGVVGEAGVGKSRICDEFARSCQARGVNVLRARGVSHGTSVPYLPVLELLRNYFGITDVDSPRQAREKIAGRLVRDRQLARGGAAALLRLARGARSGASRSAARRGSAPAAGVRGGAGAWPAAAPSGTRACSFCSRTCIGSTGRAEQFFEQYVESYPGTRTLVLANFRPEFHAPWMRHSYYRQIPLAPLDRRPSARWSRSIVGRDPSLAGFADHVIARTGGNPFFVEEVVRMLSEEGALEGTPGHYRLVRPLDQLGVPPRCTHSWHRASTASSRATSRSLQTASVVGITFSDAVLAAVTDLLRGRRWPPRCRRCARRSSLSTRPRDPVPEYRFWHPLDPGGGVRLDARRAAGAASTRLVAEALIELEPERLNERAALIANHFEAAGETLEAARWNNRAADWALRTDVNESIRRWRKTIALLDGLPPSDEEMELGIQARHRLARCGARAGMPQGEVDQTLEDATELAQRSGNTTALSNIVFARGAINLYRGNLRQAPGLRPRGRASRRHDAGHRAQDRSTRRAHLSSTG